MMIRRATAADADALAMLYVAAFRNNPAYASVFEGQPSHGAALMWLFQRRVRCLMASGCPIYCMTKQAAAMDRDGTLPAPAPGPEPAQPASSVIAAVGIVPFSSKPSIWLMLRHGLWQWPFLWGVSSLTRALQLDGATKAASNGMSQLRIAGELSMMAVAPEHQGEGVGNALLRHCLQEWDAGAAAADGTTGGVILGTQCARNLPFYERQGFQVLGSCVDHSYGYTTWQLYRPPEAAAHVRSSAARNPDSHY